MSDTAREFAENGFVVVQGLFTESEVATFKDEIRRILAEHMTDSTRNNGVFVGLAANSAVFKRAAADPRLLDALEPVLGPDIEFLSDKLVFKSADLDYGTPWHQDWPYWQGAHKVSVWIALDAATPENGCLKLLPGSHKEHSFHDGSAPEEKGSGFVHQLSPDAVDESRAVAVPAAAGDAVIFHDLMLHASFPNRSGRDRWALISTYRNAAEPDLEYEWSVAAEVVRGRGR